MQHVIVSDYGSFLSKTSERLVVKGNKQVVREIPFFDLEQITVASKGVSLSAEVIRVCAEQGIPITFLSGRGEPYALLSSPTLTATASTRREQYKALEDKRGLTLAKEIVDAKIHNQSTLLKYAAKYRKERDTNLYSEIMDLAKKVDAHREELKDIQGRALDSTLRGQLLSVEGRASRMYWEGFETLMLKQLDFPGREHRGAEDPINSLLNYGYGILYNQMHCALLLGGLEPFAGFMHVDRPGKHSLVLDMVEEFRQPVVDRTVLSYVNRGAEIRVEEGRLPDAVRKEFAAKVRERLESTELYEGKKLLLKTIIERQARHLATFVRGEGKYKAFRSTW
ncbi:MAG: CRISPR-associated endonuclease Cas1 [Desulfitobacteriaceae bacterium]